MSAQKLGRRGPGRPSYEKLDGRFNEIFRQEARGIILSRDAGLPLWQQLSGQLENLIYSGKLAPDSRLPSEPALCELFSVSRPVVRHAISALAAKGLVVKLPRKGMFVGAPRQESSFLTSNVSLFDDMISRGVQVRTRTYEVEKTLSSPREREALRLKEDESVVRIARVFWVGDNAITYTHMSFPANKVPGFEEADLEGQSILGLIRDNYGRRATRAERWFMATSPSKEACERMELPEGRPLIWIESIAYEKDGSPLEYYEAYYNSAAARIHIAVSD